jgi:hypothetical protein
MLKINTCTLIVYFLCTFWMNVSTAQNTKSVDFPSVILVKLSAETNRINALIKAKRFNDLEKFKSEAEIVRNVTIADFNDNFNYCPVYYFIDTNMQLIIDGKFEGVLLNKDLSVATNTPLNDSSNMHSIVYYGFPQWQTKKGKWDTTKSSTAEGGKPFGKALVINDPKLRQIYYLYWLDNDFFNFKFMSKKKNNYKYTSKKFELEYYPFAAELNRKLYERKRKLMRKNATITK